MEHDKTQRDPFIQIVEDHLASGEPPETKAAYDALMAKDRSASQAKALIAGAIRIETQEMMAKDRAFDSAHYKTLLDKILADT